MDTAYLSAEVHGVSATADTSDSVALSTGKIFSSIGLSSISKPVSNCNIPVVFKGDGSSFLRATVPITGLTIKLQSDVNVTKALSGDFFVTSFGDTPVTISLNGLLVITKTCNTFGTKSVLKFFLDYKVSKDIKKRLTVIIQSTAGVSQRYSCVITAVLQETTSTAVQIGTVAFSLSLIGIIK